MKRIAMISTGGTIAMQADASGLANSALGARKLLELANIDRTDIPGKLCSRCGFINGSK